MNRTLLDECFRVKGRTPDQAQREALRLMKKEVPKQVA